LNCFVSPSKLHSSWRAKDHLCLEKGQFCCSSLPKDLLVALAPDWRF